MAMDQDDLLRLLLAHRGMLLGYTLSIVRDFHLAEDIFQEASVIVLKKGSILDSEDDFAPWARKVVRLEAMNALRRQNKGPGLLDPEMLDGLEQEWCKRDSEPSMSLTALRECIEQLGPKARRLIELRYVEGISGGVLAARLNQPLNTVYVTLSRLYKALSQCVEKRLAHTD
jgi:RNA polymerase sigma-70 factor, ECF subfamily